MIYKIKIPETGKLELMRKEEECTVPSPGVREVLINTRAIAVNYIDTIIHRGEMCEGMKVALHP